MICISKKTIISKLHTLGIKKGDILFVHSSLGLIFGKQSSPCELLYSSLREVIGTSGTIVVPTFTFKCCHGEVFDPYETDSETGIFSNWIRTLPVALRSHHPIHSLAAIGPMAEEIVKHKSPSSFGEGSSFQKLIKMDALNLLVGVGINYLTMIHQVEEDLLVPYRFFKNFMIKIKQNGKIEQITVPYYAKHLDRNTRYRYDVRRQTLEAGQSCSSLTIGWGSIMRCDSKKSYDILYSETKKNPYFFINKNLFLNKREDNINVQPA